MLTEIQTGQSVVDTEPVVGKVSVAPPEFPKRTKVMLVDDEKLCIQVVAEYLKSDGYRKFVHTADSVAALSLIRQERPDVVLLDIQMPQVNGLEILQQIRADESLARTSVIILTATTNDEIKRKALDMGATDFLQKPIHRRELLTRLRNIIMARAYQDHLQQHSEMLEQLFQSTLESFERAIVAKLKELRGTCSEE